MTNDVESITALIPDWSRPQWEAAGAALADLPNNRLTIDLISVEAEKVLDELRARVESNRSPDIVMLPVDVLDPCEDLPIADLLQFETHLADTGAALLEADDGTTIGITTLWAINWFVATTKASEAVADLLAHVSLFRDSRLPTSPAFEVDLTFHEHILRMPREFGVGDASIHFNGELTVEVEVSDANPNEGTIRVLDVRGEVPLEKIPFDLASLPWSSPPALDSDSNTLSLALRAPAPFGRVNFLTGELPLRFGLRIAGAILEEAGLEPIDIDMNEQCRWDLSAGTLYVESGTATLVGGPLPALTMEIVAGSKNETRVITTKKTGAWVAIDVKVLPYGTTPSSKKLLATATKLFKKLSKKGAKIAHMLSQAISIRQARSVFIVYVCVVTETFQGREKKEGKWASVGKPYTVKTVTNAKMVELPDEDSVPWWGGRKPSKKQAAAIASRNAPKDPCP